MAGRTPPFFCRWVGPGAVGRGRGPLAHESPDLKVRDCRASSRAGRTWEPWAQAAGVVAPTRGGRVGDGFDRVRPFQGCPCGFGGNSDFPVCWWDARSGCSESGGPSPSGWSPAVTTAGRRQRQRGRWAPSGGTAWWPKRLEFVSARVPAFSPVGARMEMLARQVLEVEKADEALRALVRAIRAALALAPAPRRVAQGVPQADTQRLGGAGAPTSRKGPSQAQQRAAVLSGDSPLALRRRVGEPEAPCAP